MQWLINWSVEKRHMMSTFLRQFDNSNYVFTIQAVCICDEQIDFLSTLRKCNILPFRKYYWFARLKCRHISCIVKLFTYFVFFLYLVSFWFDDWQKRLQQISSCYFARFQYNHYSREILESMCKDLKGTFNIYFHPSALPAIIQSWGESATDFDLHDSFLILCDCNIYLTFVVKDGHHEALILLFCLFIMMLFSSLFCHYSFPSVICVIIFLQHKYTVMTIMVYMGRRTFFMWHDYRQNKCKDSLPNRHKYASFYGIALEERPGGENGKRSCINSTFLVQDQVKNFARHVKYSTQGHFDM